MLITSFDFNFKTKNNLKSLLRQQGLFIDFNLLEVYQKHFHPVKRGEGN